METAKKGVLYVDDDEQNLVAFKGNFRRDYNVFTANSAENGLKVLEENERSIQVILSDYKMPKISGVEFFVRVLKMHPQPIKVILTGHADIEGVIDAINKGEIYRFIRKPWVEEEIRNVINNGFEIYHTRELLKEKNEELLKSNAELDRFVYSASHDLRAPLMSILGLIQVAKMQPGENHSEYLAMIEKSVNKLDIFIKNIIDYHRNKNVEQKFTEINFEPFIKDVIDTFEYYNDKPNVEFKINVSQNESFKTDEMRLRVIFNNIVSNAIKYQKKNTPGQQVSFDVNVENGMAAIKIADNGIGIHQDHLNEIFKMYFRATHENAGSGIGLYIVKEALGKINGQIEVASAIGEGTSFKMILPNMG